MPLRRISGTSLQHKYSLCAWTGRNHETSQDRAILVFDGPSTWVGLFDGMGSLPHADEVADRCCDALQSALDEVAWTPASLLAQINADLIATFGLDTAGAAGVVAHHEHGQLFGAWLGDCRALIPQEGGWVACTRDHTRLADALDRNPSRAEAAQRRSLADNLTRSLGETAMAPSEVPSFVADTDSLALVSDGNWADGHLLEACLSAPQSHGPKLADLHDYLPDDDATFVMLSDRGGSAGGERRDVSRHGFSVRL